MIELEERLKKSQLSENEKSILRKGREVTIRGEGTGLKCPPGYDYCWQCGHVAPFEEFLKNDRCPNPSCPRPKFWND